MFEEILRITYICHIFLLAQKFITKIIELIKLSINVCIKI